MYKKGNSASFKRGSVDRGSREQKSSTYTIKRVIGKFVPEKNGDSFSISRDGRLVTPEDRGGSRQRGSYQSRDSYQNSSRGSHQGNSRGSYQNRGGSTFGQSGHGSSRGTGGSYGQSARWSAGGSKTHSYGSSYSHDSHSSYASKPQYGSGGGYQRGSYNRSGYQSGGSGRYNNRGGFGGNFRGSSKRKYGSSSIDVSRFVNKNPLDQASLAHMEFVPTHNFADFEIDEKLKENVLQKGYALPTPIQDQSIPHILEGKDVVGLANTGTGKTAAFLIPLVHKAIQNKKEQILIVVPTRELAVQIEDELRGFAKGLGLYGVVCVGGTNIAMQIRSLRYHNNFIIGTPGRIKDLIERNVLDLSQVKSVVLDESDRMLDMGFVHDIKFMMSLMPEERQTLFFSATVTKEIEALISTFLKNPVHVSVRTGDTAKTVYQDIVRIEGGQSKFDVLSALLQKPEFEKVLVFGNTKHGVERLTRELKQVGIQADSIHGDKNQASRQRSLNLFKQHEVKVLIATDVAARGLDISGVSHVINYDLPATYEDYVHRIGRTGRGGKTGVALTFVS